MRRRYIFIGIFILLLIGAYFIFFYKNNKNNDYKEYYTRLLQQESFSNTLEGLDLSVEEIEENGKYSYVITIDDAMEKYDDVKVLVVNGSCSEEKIEAYPSFGIIDSKGYSLIPKGEKKVEKELKGINLTILETEKIEYLLVYFSGNGNEQFVKVKVSNLSS